MLKNPPSAPDEDGVANGLARSDGTVSVIVPTLNEAGNIGPLIDSLLGADRPAGLCEILVVDDGSTDGTVSEIEACGAGRPVRAIRRNGPADLTASVLDGACSARGEFCVIMDADGSHPAEAVHRLLEPLRQGRADVVVGSRHVAGGGIRDWPRWRRLLSRAAALLAWPFTRVRDPMSGFFATRTDRLAQLEPVRAGYKVLLELLVRTRPEPRVVEVPFVFNDRGAGNSKMTWRTQWLFMRRLAALGGARVTLGNLSRFSLVGLSGVGVDLSVFWLLQSLDAGLATAHFTAFLAATLSNFALNYRWSFARQFDPAGNPARRYAAFLIVALLAFTIRGGVLAVLSQGLGIAPSWAILPAVAMTAAVNYLGSVFYVFPARGRDVNPEIRWHMASLALIAAALLLRWLYLGRAELIFDEMYYWVYTQHPALSYLDHPPLTAWLIAAGTRVFGENAFGVRAATLVLGPLAIVFGYLYARDIFDKTRGLIAAMLVAVVPAWFGSGFLMTPDAIVVPAWLAALYFLHRALIEERAAAWLGVAVSIGIGALGKYTIAFLVPAIVFFMLAHPPSRKWLLRPEPWLGAAVTLLTIAPVLAWNAAHDWASFAFQSTRRLEQDPEFTAFLLPLQTVVALAPLAGIAALCLLGPVRRSLCGDDVRRRFMLTMTLTPIGIFLLFGLGTEIKHHWLVPAWLGLLPLIAATVRPPDGVGGSRLLRVLQRLWKPLLPLSLIALGLALHYISLGLPGIPWQPNRLGYMGWPEIAREVHRLERELEAETGRRPIIAGMAKWNIPAALSFHDVDGRRGNITGRNLVGMSGSQWEMWFDPATDPGRPVLLVSHERKLIDEAWLEDAVAGLGPLRQIPVYRNGMVIQRLFYRIGDGFHPEQLRYPGHTPE
ncbi:MAG: glycosyltransferase family 39 protein [Wenzhouxiangellaceae bacterium]|nr:glycosyltransferase family 39 protein [Wenzhouxiangellaceae bacterium]